MIKNPNDFIRSMQDRQVEIHLQDDGIVTGTFVCLDGNLNVVLRDCTDQASGCTFSDVLIRGNNVNFIIPKNG